MTRPKLNAEWHRDHRMPPNPTLDQRVEWHLAHQQHCGCREMPASIRREIARRESKAPETPAQE